MNDINEKKLHTKKLIAPIVITVILVLYYIAFVVVCLTFQMPLAAKLIGGVVPLALAGVCIYVLIERIKEIRSGEEDDIGKY